MRSGGPESSPTRPCEALQRVRAAAAIFVSPRDALSPPRALPGDRMPRDSILFYVTTNSEWSLTKFFLTSQKYNE
jgi:hypothetical protein